MILKFYKYAKNLFHKVQQRFCEQYRAAASFLVPKRLRPNRFDADEILSNLKLIFSGEHTLVIKKESLLPVTCAVVEIFFHEKEISGY